MTKKKKATNRTPVVESTVAVLPQFTDNNLIFPVPKKKVAVVGTASRTMNKAPYDDPEFEIWGLAWRVTDSVKFDRMFDMHPIDSTRTRLPADYLKHLETTSEKKKVYLAVPHPKVPKAITYPLEEVTKYIIGEHTQYGYNSGHYFMSSIAYMFGLAMYEGFEEIHIYGVDLLDDDEYIHQKPNQEYLIALARGRGIKVYIPDDSALVKGTHIYGYETPPGEGAITVPNLEQKLMEYQKKHDEHMTAAFMVNGAMQELRQQIAFMKRIKNGINTGAYR